MGAITLVFPHQLFINHPAVHRERPVVLVEDSLYFGDRRYPLRFHKHKLLLHFATMEYYAGMLREQGFTVDTVRYRREETAVEALTGALQTIRTQTQTQATGEVRDIHLCQVTDDILQRRIERVAREQGLTLHWYPSPAFLTPRDWLREQVAPGVHASEAQNDTPVHDTPVHDTPARPPRMHTFYIAQRRRMGILLDAARGEARRGKASSGEARRGEAGPLGGRWSFDSENRKSWPVRTAPPPEPVAAYDARSTALIAAAAERVNREFPENPGRTGSFWYPVTHRGAREWLDTFLRERFQFFGPYEDAIAREGTVLYHSVLTPMLNIGLITPGEVLAAVEREYPESQLTTVRPEILPGLEGFVRQIIGWREYICGVYLHYGVTQRRGNVWDHHHPMPEAFYTATTGIAPLDQVIRRVLDRSYCHHIERLMVLGNAMLLCEIDPRAVYRWFMELFIDAYDWVMVPNVYGMSQFADGGLLATKPYISGANYIRKMSDYPRGEWEDIWTALFWRFMHRHRTWFEAQPRLGMLTRQLDRDPGKTAQQIARADRYLEELHRSPTVPTQSGTLTA